MTQTPFDEELENMIIGHTLINKRLAISEKTISTLDFFSEENQRIWSAMMEIDENGTAIEIWDVVAAINDSRITGSLLAQKTLGVPGTAVRAADVRRLKELATLRRMVGSFGDLAERASSKRPIADILADAQATIDSVRSEQEASRGTSRSIREVMEEEVFPRLDDFVSGKAVKVPFGFDTLDEATNGGSSPGELVVFGALPKSGKSCLMLQVAREQAEKGLPAYIASLEMMDYENGFRHLAQDSEFSVNVFRPGMVGFVRNRLKAHAASSFDLPLRFDDKARTMRDIGNEIARLKDSVGVKSAFIDYVQLIRSERRQMSRSEKIEEAIYDMKDLAMKHEIVVYTAAQFNRDGIKSERPTLAHFDGSSAIEKAANLAIFWTLGSYDLAVQGRRGKLWVELGRSVAVSNEDFDIVFQGDHSRFSFADEVPELYKHFTDRG